MKAKQSFPLLIHVGYPKAGSTWLQKSIFTQEEAGFCSPWGEIPSIAIEHIRVVDTFIFDEILSGLRAEYEEGMGNARSRGLIPVLSYEHFLLDPLGGNSADIREGARRISKLFPNGKILLIIREQKSIILSAYLEHLRRGVPAKIDRFIGFDSIRKPGFGCACPLDMFLYDRIINYLYEIFGKDNVLVMPLEITRESQFPDALYSFLGVESANEELFTMAKPARQARKSDYFFLRHLNYIGMSRYIRQSGDSFLRKAAYGINQKLSPLIPDSVYKAKKKAMQNQIEGYIGDFFNESNSLTSDLIGIDLKTKGYKVSTQCR
jgi:hypothetical protein